MALFDDDDAEASRGRGTADRCVERSAEWLRLATMTLRRVGEEGLLIDEGVLGRRNERESSGRMNSWRLLRLTMLILLWLEEEYLGNELPKMVIGGMTLSGDAYSAVAREEGPMMTFRWMLIRRLKH